MKRIKSVVATAMIISMITSSNALAVIPDSSVIIGERVYDLNYAQSKANLKEIRSAILQNNYDDIFVKDIDGNWYHEFTKQKINPKSLPDIVYKNKEGKMSIYEEGDGDKKDLQTAEFGLNNLEFAAENVLHINLNYEIKELNDLSITIDGQEIPKDSIEIIEKSSTIKIQLNEKLKKEDYALSIKVEGEVESAYGDKAKLNCERSIFVINGEENGVNLGKSYEGDVTVLTSNRDISGLNVNGNLSIYGANCKLNNLKISKSIIIDNGKEGKLQLENTECPDINVKSSNNIKLYGVKATRLTIDSKTNSKITLEDYSQIGKTIIKKPGVLENNKGSFGKIIVYNENTQNGAVIFKGEFQDVLVKSNSYIKSDVGSKIENLVISTLKEKDKINLEGKFERVIVDSKIQQINLLKNSSINTLILNNQVEVKGDKTCSIGKVEKNNNVTPQIDEPIVIGGSTGGGIYIGGGGVSDTEKPVLKLKGEATVQIEVGVIFEEPGFTATDNRDGDITNKVKTTIINSKGEIVKSIDTSKEDTFTITYYVQDKAGNKAEITRTVKVAYGKDVEKPVIKLKGMPVIEIMVQNEFTDEGVTATDNRDGDITNKVKTTITKSNGDVVEAVDTSVKETFTIVYSVEDAAGNKAEAIRIVKVMDTQEDNEIGPQVYSMWIDNREPELFDKLTLQVFTKSSEKGRAQKAYAVYTSESGKEFGLEMKLHGYIYKGEILADEILVKESWKLSYIITEDLEGNVDVSYNTNIHTGQGVRGIDMKAADINVTKDMVGPKFISAKADCSALENLGNAKIYIEFEDESGLEDTIDVVYRSQDGKEIRIPMAYNGDCYYEELDEIPAGHWRIDYIVARDKKQNVTVVYNSKLHSLSKTDLSKADINIKEDIIAPKFESINVDVNEVTEYENTVNITLKALDQSQLAEEAVVVYQNTDGEAVKEKSVALKLVDGKYLGKINVFEEEMIKGNWKVSHVVLEDVYENVSVVYNNKSHAIGEDLSNGNFKYNEEGVTLGIKEIRLSNNEVELGNSIKVEVVPEESKIPLKEEAVIKYRTRDKDILEEKYVELKLENGIYTGTIETNNSEDLGEWHIDFITLEDTEGNTIIQYNKVFHPMGVNMSQGAYKVIGGYKVQVLEKSGLIPGKEAIYSVKISNYIEQSREFEISIEILDSDGNVIKSITNISEIDMDESILINNIFDMPQRFSVIKISVMDTNYDIEGKTLVFKSEDI